MTIQWQEMSPVLVGLITFGLMWGDWFLTTLQERERSSHYAEHYQSYPINTIEGNPMLQSSASIFIAGTAIAGLTTTLRQLLWLRKVPAIAKDNLPPKAA